MTNAVLGHTGRYETTTMSATVLASIGRYATLYGIVLVFAWIGAMKFTAYEAGAIEGLVASSPLLSWLYAIFDQRGAANLIGVVEIVAAILLATRPWSARAGAAGAAMVAATTAVTLTLLVTAPGWEPSLGGFPALSVVPGQFLIKDAVLFGAALWILGDALREIGVARR
ncbi:MAG: YkgB family protein [Geminicoccaceae bacterium]